MNHSNSPESTVIALKYDDTSSAPYVVAKGEGYLADKIMALAETHNIPLYQNADLVSLW